MSLSGSRIYSDIPVVLADFEVDEPGVGVDLRHEGVTVHDQVFLQVTKSEAGKKDYMFRMPLSTPN